MIVRETLCESGRCIDGLRFLRRGVWQREKEVGRFFRRGDWLLKKGGGFLRNCVEVLDEFDPPANPLCVSLRFSFLLEFCLRLSSGASGGSLHARASLR